jgi:hypothetical protein
VTRAKKIELQLADLLDRLDQIERHTDKMELILMVREPGSAAAADAYEGLRKQIVAAVTDRLAHLTQLVQFDSALRNGAGTEVLTAMVSGWMDAAGITVIEDAGHEQSDLLFDVVEDLGGRPEAIEPSYVDAQSSRVIRRGRMRLGPVISAAGVDVSATDGGGTDPLANDDPGTKAPAAETLLEEDQS